MTTWPPKHLTADDLDAFHSEALGSDVRAHLDTCAECRDLVVLDRRVLAMLAQMPSLAPRAGFADGVLSRVRIADPTPVPVLSYPRLTRGRAAAIVATVVGMAASAAWSVANRSLLDAWLDRTATGLLNTGTALWQNGLTFVASQPWFETVRQLSGTPARLVLASVVAVGVYATGLVALRRLVTPSTGTVSNAGA